MEEIRENENGRKIAINFENFTFQYESQSEPTLHDINLKIYEGEKVVIIGPSGSGKSTMGHCINGLAPYFYKGNITGKLEIYGKQLNEIFEHSKYVGTVLQDSDAQFVGLSVAEDIAFVLENDEVETNEELTRLIAEYAKRYSRKPHLANIYILEKLKIKEDIVEFFKYISIQTTNSYTDNNLHDVVNISKVQEKILLALSDLNSNVNATLVLERFLFTILLDNNNLDFLLRG